MEFRNLTENEIDVRIARVTEKGVALLLYKNARTDSSILDETVGAEKWQDRFYECKGNLYCSVGIKCGDEWIWKDDCGAETYTEKEKGEASDAFKRACFKWGIGKELYTSPFIWVNAEDLKEFAKGKCNDKFRVKHIVTENKKIVQLVIYNEKKRCDCFSYGMPKSNNDDFSDNKITQEQIEALKAADQNRVAKALSYFKKSSVGELTFDEAAQILRQLKK